MTVRPILFSGPMVRALLDGRKTQTRRVVSCPGVEKVIDFVRVATDEAGRPVFEMKDAHGKHVSRPAGANLVDHHFSPNYGVNDLLYVRETFTQTQHGTAVYRVDATDQTGQRWGSIEPGDPKKEVLWKPSIFMPRAASRLTLKVTDVRVEPLQAISAEDAKAEGIEPVESDDHAATYWRDYQQTFRALIDPRKSFQSLWDSLNEKRGLGWNANPWVVAVTFDVRRCNVDQFERGAA